MAKEEIIHLDAIGRPLKVGDPVAVARSTTSLTIGSITAIGKKQIRVVKYGQPARVIKWNGKETANGTLRYPDEAVLLDGQDIMMYLLQLPAQK